MLEEREKTHGPYLQVATTSQKLKTIMMLSKNWPRLTEPQAEAIEMIASKLARILNGNPSFRDHWDDIAGYAQLASLAAPSPIATIEQDIAAIVAELPPVEPLPDVVTRKKVWQK
jgi:hypothetical protein